LPIKINFLKSRYKEKQEAVVVVKARSSSLGCIVVRIVEK
jgi:hypothetical protein